MSTTLLPIPSRASATIAAHVRGSAASASSGAPKQARPRPKFAAVRLRADERERDDRADDRADAGRRLQEPDAGVAEVEQLERDDDDEHAVGARDERLRAVEPDHDAQARLAPHGAEAGGDPACVFVLRAAPAAGRSVFGMRATNDALQR